MTMAKTAAQITEKEMAVYQNAAREREELTRQEQEQRARRAWASARRAAAFLRDEFGARRVVLFGSLARGDRFHQRSDIDVAVEGIEPRAFWRAWSAVDSLDTEFEINLVDMQMASSALHCEIEKRGVEL
jgi:predicted nucleotidyltransferase